MPLYAVLHKFALVTNAKNKNGAVQKNDAKLFNLPLSCDTLLISDTLFCFWLHIIPLNFSIVYLPKLERHPQCQPALEVIQRNPQHRFNPLFAKQNGLTVYIKLFGHQL